VICNTLLDKTMTVVDVAASSYQRRISCSFTELHAIP
jgi:hypothetical protein